MKKLLVLRVIIILLFGVLLLQITTNIYIVIADVLFGKGILKLGLLQDKEPTSLLKIMVVIKLISVILFTIGVFLIVKTIRHTKVKEYFEVNSYKNFRNAGILLSFSGVLAILIIIQSFVSLNVEPMIYLDSFNINPHLFSLVLGLFFVFFSLILKQGVNIKKENDLTI